MRPRFRCLSLVLVLAWAGSAYAHPVPFSYLDLRLSESEGTTSGTLVVHDFDASYELGLLSQATLLEPTVAARYRDELIRIFAPRLTLLLDGKTAAVEWGALEVLPQRQSLRFAFTIRHAEGPSRVRLQAVLFPYDPAHQTFLNIYEGNRLVHQAILDAAHPEADYYTGAAQGLTAVVKTFLLSGIEHILIGPDHVLFLIGLLLLGGSMRRLALIVSAFTVGHSITLSLAALDIYSPSSRVVEPLIALTIVVVGADNLLVLRDKGKEARRATDIRAPLAAAFGLIHGFGFASVLKEFGLPQAALGWSLFAFNAGVEIGQLLIVSVVSLALGLLARRNGSAAARVAYGGSIAVILAGAYWFVERTFLSGG